MRILIRIEAGAGEALEMVEVKKRMCALADELEKVGCQVVIQASEEVRG